MVHPALKLLVLLTFLRFSGGAVCRRRFLAYCGAPPAGSAGWSSDMLVAGLSTSATHIADYRGERRYDDLEREPDSECHEASDSPRAKVAVSKAKADPDCQRDCGADDASVYGVSRDCRKTAGLRFHRSIQPSVVRPTLFGFSGGALRRRCIPCYASRAPSVWKPLLVRAPVTGRVR